ncbi:MAG TPA: Crp/Fnr family transcriptional regulator [Caulobacteraceae bacterium]
MSVGRIVAERGSVVTDVYFPSSGVFSIVTLMEDGEAVESLTVGREGAIGLVAALGEPVSEARAIVQISGSAWRISAERLREVAGHHPVIARVAIRYSQVTVAQLHQAAACNALHEVGPRLCRWLLTCEDRIGDNVVPLTQEFLAMMLGVQRTSVTAAAQALQVKGLIRYQRGRITILDRRGLEAAACECYRFSEQTFDHMFGSLDKGAA